MKSTYIAGQTQRGPGRSVIFVLPLSSIMTCSFAVFLPPLLLFQADDPDFLDLSERQNDLTFRSSAV